MTNYVLKLETILTFDVPINGDGDRQTILDCEITLDADDPRSTPMRIFKHFDEQMFAWDLPSNQLVTISTCGDWSNFTEHTGYRPDFWMNSNGKFYFGKYRQDLSITELWLIEKYSWGAEVDDSRLNADDRGARGSVSGTSRARSKLLLDITSERYS